mmetsp:Transcript_11407/g.35118  ORF Transcript_11407/g.35118 Transcript_11407/m.35118 type:complete len:345 (+) Transcript_11407:301-1335(+)
MSRAVRQRHAKRLASARYALICKCEAIEKSSLAAPSAQQRSARLVSRESAVYSVMLENCRSLASGLRTAAVRVADVCSLWCNVRRADEVALLQAALREIMLCLGYGFGGRFCSTHICLLNPGGKTVTWNSKKGQTNLNLHESMFRCMNNCKTIVVETTGCAEQMGISFLKSLSSAPFPLVCSPLRAETGHPLGVLIVDNLCSPLGPSVNDHPNCRAFKSIGHCKDYHHRLAPFIDKNDEACKQVKLWKMTDRTSPGESDCAARIICGRVVSTSRSAGANLIYTIQWEDGSYSTEVSFRVIKELLRWNPASLGVGVPSDDASVLAFIEYAGKVIGEHLIRLCKMR